MFSFLIIVLYLFSLIIVPGSPVDLKEELVNGNDVVLTWTPPNTPNGVITGYQIIYSGHERSQVD